MKKGFTLVEVIVTLAIMAIVGVMFTTVLVSVNTQTLRKNELNNIKSLIGNMHQSFLIEPKDWKETFLSNYEVDSLDYKEGYIYLDKQFEKPLITTSNFYIRYEVLFDEVSNSYSLLIIEIIRDGYTIDSNINLGKMISG